MNNNIIDYLIEEINNKNKTLCEAIDIIQIHKDPLQHWAQITPHIEKPNLYVILQEYLKTIVNRKKELGSLINTQNDLDKTKLTGIIKAYDSITLALCMIMMLENESNQNTMQR